MEFPRAMSRTSRVISLFLFLSILLPASFASGLSLDEAIALAQKNFPNYQASLKKVSSTEALYKASLSPYLPSVDGTATEDQHHASAATYNTYNYKIAMSYTLFDGGKRSANRKIAGANLDVDKEETRKTLIELSYNVKSAFFSAVAQSDMLAQRKMQLQYAEKDHEVAKGRNKLGQVKRSDVLQALVRLEQARFNIIQAEGDLRKALAELNSLMGCSLQTPQKLTDSLEEAILPPDEDRLLEAAQKRPEIVQAASAIDIANENRSLARSAFYPLISVSGSHEKSDSGIYRISYPEEEIVGVSANWNLFEWGKFYKVAAARYDIDAAELRLQEAKRKVLLDLEKAKDDFLTSSEKLRAADQQLEYADHNYRQAFGEYKAGKGDILSLVQAESLLADAKGQQIDAKLSVIAAKVQWEKTAGLLVDAARQELVRN